MSGSELVDQADGKPLRRQGMKFRQRSNGAPPTPDQARRQSDIVRSAWRHFREAAPMIAFLNSRHDALEGQPLHLAIESDERASGASNGCCSNSMHSGEPHLRRKRDPESNEHRSFRLLKNAHDRREQVSAADKALDAAVRRSIEEFGA